MAKCNYCESPICINCECANHVLECDHLCPNCIDKHNGARELHYLSQTRPECTIMYFLAKGGKINIYN